MHCTLRVSAPASSFRRSESKMPRNAASVLPLPVGEVRRIDSRSRMAGTQSRWACVTFAKAPLSQLASCGCKGASNLKDAFSMATKQLSATYRDVKIGKVAEQKQGGITFFGGQGEGEKDGFELTLVVAAFTPDAKRFFGLAWSRDDASGDVYIKDIDQALASIQPFKEVSKPLK